MNEETIQNEVLALIEREKSLAELEKELAQNEQFQNFLKAQKEVQVQVADAWKLIEAQMIENNIKSVKGDWGYITIAERIGFDYDKTELPKKFYKVVIDESKVSATYKLEGKVKGATPRWKKYLTKKIK